MKVLLLHGALGAAKQMEGIRDLFPNAEVKSLDFLSHGYATQEPLLTMDLLQEQLDYFLEEQGWTKDVICFGYSMGGYVAMLHESRKVGTFSKIYTLGTKMDWSPEGALKEVKFLDPDVIEAKVPKFKLLLESYHGDQWRNTLGAVAHLMLNLGDAPKLTSMVLGKVGCPVYVHRGSKDKMVSAEECQQLVSDLPNASYTELEDQDHPIEMVDLGLFQKGILQV